MPVVILQLGVNRINVHRRRSRSRRTRQAHARSFGPCCGGDAPLAAPIALLRANGVAIEEGPVPRPAADAAWGSSVYFRDPDGNLIELLSTVA
jgi:catechol 2,3-dioxygenase-like lactoylglutathione lyase family enzyme